ncbi:MAG: NB-ARC domain-containing protein, partial [Planktothrix sp.]
LNQNIPLISVLGLPGIGKTSLVKRFIDLNIDKFDAVIWKSLKIQPGLDHNITSILTKMGYVNPNLAEHETPLCQLLNSSILRDKKCLIIWDDVQEIFNMGVFSGQYKTEHKDYQELFRRIAETSHQSHFILLSQESSQDMLGPNDDFAPVKYLELKGLKGINFLSDRGLTEKEYWSKLIQIYEGHPGYLKDVAQLIKDIFAGKVSDFLAEPEIMLTLEIKTKLAVTFQRLSGIEKQILMQLSKTDQPQSRIYLKQSLSLSLSELIDGLQSLNRRYLIQKIEEETMLFKVSNLVKEYMKTCDFNG